MVVGMAVGTAYATQPPRPRRRLRDRTSSPSSR